MGKVSLSSPEEWLPLGLEADMAASSVMARRELRMSGRILAQELRRTEERLDQLGTCHYRKSLISMDW